MSFARLVPAPLLALALLLPAASAGAHPLTAPQVPDAAATAATATALAQGAAPASPLPTAAGVAASATGAVDPDVAKADELLAEAHEKAKLAARRAHTAEAAKARLERLHEKLAAQVGERASANADARAQLFAHLRLAHENALLESEAARADAFDLAAAAKERIERRLAEARSAAEGDVRGQLEARLARAGARANAFAASAPQDAIALAERAVAEAEARLATARAMDDQAAIAEAERLLAFAQKMLDQVEERVEHWNARIAAGATSALERPSEAPFEASAQARGAVRGHLSYALAQG